MNLANVELINFIDKSKVEINHPALTVQRIVTFFETSYGEATSTQKVLSLTQKHWKIFDALIDYHGVTIQTLFGTAKRYQKVKPCQFDQAMEFCLDAINRVFDLDRNHNLGKLSKAWDNEEEQLLTLDGSMVANKMLH